MTKEEIHKANADFEQQVTQWAKERISAEFGDNLSAEQIQQVTEYSYEVDNFDPFLGWGIRNALEEVA